MVVKTTVCEGRQARTSTGAGASMAQSECGWIARVSPACPPWAVPPHPGGLRTAALLLSLALLGAAAVLCHAWRRRRSCGGAREQTARPAAAASPLAPEEMRALCCCPDAGEQACSATEAPAPAPPAPLCSGGNVEEQPAPAPSLGGRGPGERKAEPVPGVPSDAFFLSPRFRPVPTDWAIARSASPDSINYTTCASSRTQSIQVRRGA